MLVDLTNRYLYGAMSVFLLQSTAVSIEGPLHVRSSTIFVPCITCQMFLLQKPQSTTVSPSSDLVVFPPAPPVAAAAAAPSLLRDDDRLSVPNWPFFPYCCAIIASGQ